MKRFRQLFLIIGLILFVTGYVYTIYYIFNKAKDISPTTGQIGDTLGGILGPIINLVGVILVYISFRTQTSANEIQTKQLQSQISWNHYQVVFLEFEQIKKELTELRFDFNRMKELFSTNEIENFKDVNGIYYQDLMAWIFISTTVVSQGQVIQNINDKNKVTNFRNNILHPLHKVYDKLLELLKDIQKDDNISIEFKKKLYKRVEIDLLPIYLRFCNNETFGYIDYDFTVFNANPTVDFRKDYFRINDFYLNTRLEITDENLLQFKNLQFYKDTK